MSATQKKLWVSNWKLVELKKWWRTIDPKSYFPDNPFNENGHARLSHEDRISEDLIFLCLWDKH